MVISPLVVVWVALGSALGGVLRYLGTELSLRLLSSTFPWGTVAINIVGSFVIGFFIVVSGPDGRWSAGPEMRHFVATGILGGFTTFSAFSLQTVALAQEGAWAFAAANIVGSVVLCVTGAWLGHVLGVAVSR